ncbi:hypothetical protein [Nocardioides sp. WS12]|nr:hypothetical protein [Nocardioides sp. WS12]
MKLLLALLFLAVVIACVLAAINAAPDQTLLEQVENAGQSISGVFGGAW